MKPGYCAKAVVDKGGSSYLLGRGRAGDHPHVAEMYENVFPRKANQGLPPENEKQRRIWLQRIWQHAENFLVWKEDAVVGHCSLMADGALRDAEFMIFVLQPFRGKGLGSLLTQAAVDHAREMNLALVWLTVALSNFRAINLYRKFGFVFAKDMGYDPVMVLHL